MTRTAAEQDLDVFMSMISQNCAVKLAELDREVFAAKCMPLDAAVVEDIAERRRRLEFWPKARAWALTRPGTPTRKIESCQPRLLPAHR